MVFQPYETSLDFEGSHLKISLFHGALSCMDITEPYMPDKVARQFGRVQDIPGPTIEPTRAYRLADPLRYRVDYPNASWAWRHRHSKHRVSLDSIGPPVRAPWDCTDRYTQWYTPRTHPTICPPEHWYAREHFSNRGNYGQDYPSNEVHNSD